MGRHSRLKRNLVTSTLLLASALTGYGRRSYAGCVSTGAPNYLCSGANTTPLSVTANNATVTTDNTFSVYTGGGNAITVTGDGNLISFTDTYHSSITSTSNYGLSISATGNTGGPGGVLVDVNSTITGYSGGIHAVNHGSGALSVTADGDVNTIFGAAIAAYNYGSGSLDITAGGNLNGAVIGRTSGSGLTVNTAGTINATFVNGIYAVNNGNGATTITATGDVNSDGAAGIYARDNFSAGDMTITAGHVYGRDGIAARQYGAGSVMNITVDSVDGLSRGIGVGNDLYSGDMTINVGSASAMFGTAIEAINNGTNANLSITAGSVTSNFAGMSIFNLGVDETINVGTVSAFARGIDVRDYGSGALSITATGDINVSLGEGIFVRKMSGTDVTLDLAGVTSGGAFGSAINAQNGGTGALSITASGDIVNTGTSTYSSGIFARNAGTDLTIDVAGVSAYLRAIDAQNTGSGALSITASGDITVSGSTTNIYDSAIVARNSGTDLTINVGKVTGGNSGIFALNTGTGALNIAASGDVSGTSNAIYAHNDNTAGTDLTISVGNVSGAGGITATNDGTGTLMINSGDVVGSYGIGIAGINTNSASANLSITSGNVIEGIFAHNEGVGALTIVAGGDVTSVLSHGIIAENMNASGTNLSITAGNVSGLNGEGIAARNSGAGALTIIAGDVIGAGGGGSGVVARNNNAAGTDLSITVGSVIGEYNGIFARNNGAGALTIYASGDVTGNSQRGIYARNNNSSGTDLTVTSGTVSGRYEGIYAKNYGTGALTITANGDVTSIYAFGILAVNKNTSGTDLSVTADDVNGANYSSGILASNYGTGTLTVTAGNIVGGNGSSDFGVFAKNNNSAATDLSVATGGASGGYIGIYARNNGSGNLVITANGDVVGNTGDGIFAKNNGLGALTVTANGNVTSTAGIFGVYARNHGLGALTIAVNGNVLGGYYGVFALNDGSDLSISTTGTVSGNQAAISAFNHGTGALTVNAAGDLLGGSGYGVRAENSGTSLSITTGEVAGDFGAILARNSGTGATHITATGDVTSIFGNGIYALSSGTGTTINAGNVYGFYNGIRAFNNGLNALKITAGDVTASYRYGIAGYNSTYANNLIITAGNVDGGSGGIKTINNGTGRTRITVGDVSGSFGNGIYANNFTGTTTSIIIDAGAVSAGLHGVYAVNNGTGKIDITTSGDVSSTLLDAISAINNAGTNLIINTGKVTASGIGGAGISATNNGSGNLSITATGDVTATGNNPYVPGTGIFAHNAGTNLSIDAAKVSGYANGIDAVNNGTGKLTIGLAGDVTGTTGSGITVDQNGTGIFKIDVPAAVAVHGGTFGIYVAGNSGAGSPGIKTAGDITGDGGTAISLNNLTASTPIVVSGGTINGDVIDDNPANGFSPVSFIESFTTNGSFDVSGIEIRKGKTLTVGSGDMLSANTFLFGVQNASNFGRIVMTDTAFALNAPIAANDGQVAVNVTGSASLAGKKWKVVDGDGTHALVNGPGGTLTQVVDNSALWDFDAADGTIFTGGDNTDLFLKARNAGPSIAARGSSNSLSTLLSLGEVSDPQLMQVMGNVNSAPTTVALNNVLDATLPGTNGVDYAASLQTGEATDNYAKSRLAALRSGEGETGMAAGDSTMGLGVWGEFFGQHVDQGRRDGVAGYDADTWGGAVGIDSTSIFDNGTLGLAFSYGHTDADSDNANTTNTDVDNYQVSIYGDYNFANRVYLNGMAGFTWGDVDTTRHNVSGTPGLTAHGDYNTQQFSAQAELGRGYAMGDSLTLTPNVMAHWVNWSPDSYTETGAGGANMHVDGDTLNKFEIGLGLKAGWSLKNNDGSLFRPELRAGYRYDLENDQVEDVAQFTGGGGSFSVPGPKPARGMVDVGGSLNLMTTRNWTFTASYDFNWKEDYTSHSGFLRAGYRF